MADTRAIWGTIWDGLKVRYADPCLVDPGNLRSQASNSRHCTFSPEEVLTRNTRIKQLESKLLALESKTVQPKKAHSSTNWPRADLHQSFGLIGSCCHLAFRISTSKWKYIWHFPEQNCRIFTVASRRKPPAPSVMDNTHICWRMFGHIELFLALIEHFLAPYEAILAPYEGMLASFEAMLAPCKPILGSCWAYVGPMLGLSWPIFGLYWPRSRILTPFEKHAKTQDSRAKMHPPS